MIKILKIRNGSSQTNFKCPYPSLYLFLICRTVVSWQYHQLIKLLLQQMRLKCHVRWTPQFPKCNSTVVDAIQVTVLVLCDRGIRRQMDIFKPLALGAHAVMEQPPSKNIGGNIGTCLMRLDL